MNKNELIKVNTHYFPELKKEDIKDTFRVAKDKLPQLGLVSRCDGRGLYKCVFPNGVSGTLAKKDGANLGAIMGEDGVVGQARWVEQSVNPTMVFAAAALHNIEEKLDEIIEISKEMFEFEQIKEEAQLQADAEFLTNTLRDYQYNVGNQLWLNSQTTVVSQCKNRSIAFINIYEKLAKDASKDAGFIDKLVHTNDKAKTKVEKAIRYLENYQKGMFLYAFSQYVHVLVSESYDEKYLEHIQNDIDERSAEYRNVFTEISFELEEYAKKSLDLKTVDFLGTASKSLGNLADKVPLINKTHVGESLNNVGDSMKQHSKHSVDDKVINISKYQKAPVAQFSENIKQISDMHHNQLEMYYDDENVYFSNKQNEEETYA